MRGRRGWRTIGGSLRRRGENSPARHPNSGAWIPIPGLLLTCYATMRKSLNLPRTQLHHRLYGFPITLRLVRGIRENARNKGECKESFFSVMPGTEETLSERRW